MYRSLYLGGFTLHFGSKEDQMLRAVFNNVSDTETNLTLDPASLILPSPGFTHLGPPVQLCDAESRSV